MRMAAALPLPVVAGLLAELVVEVFPITLGSP
jgi:hypothetical protein